MRLSVPELKAVLEAVDETAVFPATLFTLTMINVPAGRFQRDEKATNISVITQPCRMSQHEITRAQFLAIMGADPSGTGFSSGTTDPVQITNWYHAIAFCNKLSLAEGLSPVYAVVGVNHSTLAYAKAFAGSTGSNAIGDYAVFGNGSGQAGATTTQRSNPVATRLPTRLACTT